MNLVSPNGQQHQISIPSTASHVHGQRRQPVPLNLPLRDLLDGSREDYNEICVPLYHAALSGNQKAVQAILNNRCDLVRFCITESLETVLHIAVLGKSYSVLKYLLSLMEIEDLALQNANGQTALSLAAIEGVVKIAKLFVESNNALLDIPNIQGKLPLYFAAFFGKHDMVEYLYSVRKINGNVWTHESRGNFFLKCIEADMFGIALQIVEDHPELATDVNPIRVLARKPKAFEVVQRLPIQIHWLPQSQKLLRVIWRNIMKLPKAKVNEIIRGPAVHPLQQKDVLRPKSSSNVLFIAAEMGNTVFVADLIHRYPDIACEVNDNNQTIFHVAVLERHIGIYMLLHEIGTLKDSIITLEDKNGNNMLHLVGMLHEDEEGKYIKQQEMRGRSLHMHEELLWFEEVKAILPPSFQERKNMTDDLTPRELFTKTHRNIISKDKEWLKGTIEQLMVVGALIASITFAATITFAAEDEDTDSLVSWSKPYFWYFLASTSVSFAFSCLSIMMGLAILISSDTEQDFFKRTSKRLALAITSIFYSIISLLIAMFFSWTLLYKNESIETPMFLLLVAYTPLLLLSVHTVFPIFVYSINSLFNWRSIFNRKKRMLFKPRL